MRNSLTRTLALTSGLAASLSAAADLQPVGNAFANGSAYGDFRLRYENVAQDVVDASALTLRSRIGYQTGTASGFSAVVELEDSRIVAGQGSYTVGPTAYNVGQYAAIPDPETTELDQGFIQYQASGITAKIGRQVVTLDNHRFVGHVGWRQDRQTFDGVSAVFSAAKKLDITTAYFSQRNRIFAQAADIDSNDLLLNAAYKTARGKASIYAYLLDTDDGVHNATHTLGLRYTGAGQWRGTPLSYSLEYARQDSEAGDNSAHYLSLQATAVFSSVKVTLGHEVLGSDQGNYTFATPLATLHKFNGWADQFIGAPTTGIVDSYLSFGGKAAGGKWLVAYHDYQSEHGHSHYGSEINALYKRQFYKSYNAGIKYAAYSADTFKVNTDKLWVWVGAAF